MRWGEFRWGELASVCWVGRCQRPWLHSQDTPRQRQIERETAKGRKREREGVEGEGGRKIEKRQTETDREEEKRREGTLKMGWEKNTEHSVYFSFLFFTPLSSSRFLFLTLTFFLSTFLLPVLFCLLLILVTSLLCSPPTPPSSPHSPPCVTWLI